MAGGQACRAYTDSIRTAGAQSSPKKQSTRSNYAPFAIKGRMLVGED